MLLRRLAPCGCAIRLLVKRANHRGECFGVARVAEDEAIHTIVEKGRYARKNRGYDRQTAGHRFGTGMPKESSRLGLTYRSAAA